ncbi:MAG: hypothetical protein ACTHKG_11745 [Nocardioides sp.]
MTSARRPRRLPARVYWVRRTLVLAVALGMVFGIAQLLGGVGSGPTGETARVVGAEAGTTAAAPAATDDARPTGRKGERADAGKSKKSAGKKQADPKPKKTKTPLPEPTGPCAASDIVATPKVRGTAYAGNPVTFRVKLTTLETPACTWRVSPATLALKLVSGSDRIWSSQDCPRAIPETDVVVRLEKAAKVDVTWRGQRSDSTCSRTTSWAQPGWYHVQAAAFGAEPSDVQFELETPVPQTITPKPEPEKKGKNKSDDATASDPSAEKSD